MSHLLFFKIKIKFNLVFRIDFWTNLRLDLRLARRAALMSDFRTA
jgi:hypothetical protein